MASKRAPIRDSHIIGALKELNAQKKVKYPEIGYSYYTDIKGDGRNVRKVYAIIGAAGGVTYSHMNGATKRETVAKIREQIEALKAH